jgi:hypothetical protein
MWRIWWRDSLSMAFSISTSPFGCLMASVEKLVCAPAPFQSP